jgi:hypothetical protein
MSNLQHNGCVLFYWWFGHPVKDCLLLCSCSRSRMTRDVPRLVEYPLDELRAEPGEPIFVGNHNFAPFACLDAFQKPRQVFPLVLETRKDVGKEGMRGICFLKLVNLPLHVVVVFEPNHQTMAREPPKKRQLNWYVKHYIPLSTHHV